jgi:hypothetical protein
MYSFRFYDGATVHDVRYALARGCGHSAGRGNQKKKDLLFTRDSAGSVTSLHQFVSDFLFLLLL